MQINPSLTCPNCCSVESDCIRDYHPTKPPCPEFSSYRNPHVKASLNPFKQLNTQIGDTVFEFTVGLLFFSVLLLLRSNSRAPKAHNIYMTTHLTRQIQGYLLLKADEREDQEEVSPPVPFHLYAKLVKHP